MAKQSALELKRKEVREKILAMKDDHLLARMLNFLGTRFESGSLGYWLSNFVALNLIILSPWALVGFPLHEYSLRHEFLSLPSLLVVQEAILSMFVAHLIITYIFNQLTSKIIIKMNSVEKLDEFLRWFTESWSTASVLRISIPWAVVWVLLASVGFSLIFHNFVGIGYSFTVLLTGFFTGLCFYLVLWVSRLALNLRNYEYDLNTYAPADSEIIYNISAMMTRCIYVLVAFFTVATFINASKLIDPQIQLVFGFPFLLTVWMVTIAQFFLTRSTIGEIVNNAKWKTLNKIQTKINDLEANGDLSEKETAERLMRLADIHKHIMASKTQIFDWNSLSTLFSQLMLPLLGLLLGNLDKVIALFSK